MEMGGGLDADRAAVALAQSPVPSSSCSISNKARKPLTPGQELQSSKGLLHPVMATLLLVGLQYLGPGFKVLWIQAKKHNSHQASVACLT